MDRYTVTAYELSRRLTLRYSSSFGLASRLYGAAIRPHIFAIYGMVRLADEIVDTYEGADKAALLRSFEHDVQIAIADGYAPNPIIHAFVLTARQFGIDASLIDPFFASMRTDLTAVTFTQEAYERYIYGSAEVIGLMCLRVFFDGDHAGYDALEPGARALGRAYQKVNFLRDLRADYTERGRVYFPGVTFESFDNAAKQSIIEDIRADFKAARPAIGRLPVQAWRAVDLSVGYYGALLRRLESMSAESIKHERAHVPSIYKLWLFVFGWIKIGAQHG